MTGLAIALPLLTLAILLAPSSTIAQATQTRSPRVAAVLKDGMPGLDRSLTDAVAGEIRKAGYSVRFVDADTLRSTDKLSIANYDLLVLTSSALPFDSVQPVRDFLRAGGDLIALHAPLWETRLTKQGDRWVPVDTQRHRLADSLPGHLAFQAADIVSWQPTLYPSTTTQSAKAAEGPGGQPAAQVTVRNVEGYATLTSPEKEDAFAAGADLTVFAAKGDGNIRRLMVEWRERDGSRWIAVVSLSKEWRRYVLPPEAFKFWESVPSRRSDRLHPENAITCTVGVAMSHTGPNPQPGHYWATGIGTSIRTPELEQEMALDGELPAIEMLCPGYQFFPISDAATLEGKSIKTAASGAVYSVQPRPSGGGFDKGRGFRWQPLLTARSKSGAWRGTPAAMRINTDGEYKGSVWAAFGLADNKLYRNPQVLSLIRETARKMADPVYLIDGGSNFHTYLEGQTITLGATVANLGANAGDVSVKLSLIDKATKAVVFSHASQLSIAPASDGKREQSFSPDQWPVHGYTAKAELIKAGKVVDSVENEVSLWRLSETKSFVTARDGEFRRDGKLWRAVGVNYMPSSGIALADYEAFELWLGDKGYDPIVVERDLANIERMRLNSVSVFIDHRSMAEQNLLDLLRRCRNHHLLVNLSLRPGTPMNFEKDKILEIIRHYRLWENDTVFAYDLAWEPRFGNHQERRPWDGDWERWITASYGSIGNAEKDWGVSVPREDGKITNPSDQQLTTDGDWRKMVAAYRRFCDDLLYRKYGEARRLVREVDPNHLVSFRMADTSNPTANWPGGMMYDFAGLAGAVDFFAPEAYGRIGNWEKVKPAVLQTAYARWANPGLPVLWAEAGMSTWDGEWQRRPNDLTKLQVEFYKAFYRMLIETRANGVFFWWYPGGFRVYENSDFGIINPDGTDRPIARIIREESPKLLATPRHSPPTRWIEIDRDARAEGLFAVYETIRDDFWRATEAGEIVGLKTAGTGTNSATCPLTAVGNTDHSGSNPPKFLNAGLERLETKSPSGEWIRIDDGQEIPAPPDGRLPIRVTVRNLGEAQWLAAAGSGRVWTIMRSAAGTISMPVLADVPYLGVTTLPEGEIPVASPDKVTIWFSAEERAEFGRRISFSIR